MPQTIIAKPNQSMQDLVLMACGTMDGAMAFCRANGIGISDIPVVGQAYTIPGDIARNKSVLRDYRLNGTVVGTLNPELPPPLPLVTDWRILLDPRLEAIAGDIPGIGWEFVLSDSLGQFENRFPLAAAFESTDRPVLYQSKTDYEVLNTPFIMLAGFHAPPLKVIKWLNTTLMGGGFYMIWSDLSATPVTTKWEDVYGTSAIYAPLVVLKATYEINQLIPVIDVAVVSTSDTEITFHITWTHPPITFSQFNILDFSWLGAALGGTPVPGVPNCISLSLPVGVYTLGAVTRYCNDDATVLWPDSYKTLVIEVY